MPVPVRAKQSSRRLIRRSDRTAADFDNWSWSNQVGTYQTYIYVSAIQHAIEKARLLTSDAGKLACESTLRPSSGLV